MTRESDSLDRLHELNVRSLQETDPKAAECYQNMARELISYRTGEARCKYRKLLLVNGEPVADTDSAA